MEKKGSVGVTVFGIYFIINGLFASVVNSLRLSANNWYSAYSVSISILLLILGINILRLKEWSRKGIIYYQIVITFLGMFLFPVVYKQKIQSVNIHLTQKEISRIINISVTYSIMGSILLTAIVAYFFTRPKVKEQFK